MQHSAAWYSLVQLVQLVQVGADWCRMVQAAQPPPGVAWCSLMQLGAAAADSSASEAALQLGAA